MSRRRPRSTRAPAAAASPGAYESVEAWADGDWVVRRLTGSAATKPYRCPGCEQVIPQATPHLVAWPVEGSTAFGRTGADERRHWHAACWRARERRGPRR